MNIIPITPAAPACFGVACDVHARCTRYLAVDGTQADPATIATCMLDDGYPLFVEARFREPVASVRGVPA